MKFNRRTALKTLMGATAAVGLPLGGLYACSPNMATSIAGTDPGQRQLNGPQTTGRTYRNLSTPKHARVRDNDVAVPMRDGIKLRADIHRPAEPGRYPVLIAASPYPRQIQDLGAPLGFIEAGCTDFFVPRGYVHVIANLRGTCGSEGTFGFFDAQERQDMYDLVEWAAAQPWSDGNVGMVGISYFAMTQLGAAVEQPPHLKAIMPLATTSDLYEAARHHGLLCSSFVKPFLTMIGVNSKRSPEFWDGTLINLVRRFMHLPIVHKQFETMNGEVAMTGLKYIQNLPRDPHPWDDLLRAVSTEHPRRDAWWDERDLTPLLSRVKVPVYLGCDWDNVPLHLPSTFKTFQGLTNSPHKQVAMLGNHGLAWPWESLHIEALAWYDQWLKGRDTGILDGDRIRYVLPGAQGWRSTNTWPLLGTTLQTLALRADATMAADEGTPGARQFTFAPGSGANEKPADPNASLVWTGAPLTRDLDIIGDIELQLDAISTAPDTAWIAVLQDVSPTGEIENITAGYLRASLREVDEQQSRPGAPVIPCRNAQPVRPGELTRYRIPMVANARRLKTGHSLRLVVTSDDQDPTKPAIMGFRHTSIGTSGVNTINSTSRLLLTVLPAA